MTVHSGRHFLQIPGPTNVPDRVLRAMDMPTMDHRGPEFAEIGHAVLGAMQRIFRTKQPVIIYPPQLGTNFVLQMTTNPASGDWVTVTNAVSLISMEITNVPANAVFRLN